MVRKTSVRPEVQPGHVGPVGCVGNTSALPEGVYGPTFRRGCRSSRSQGLLRCGAQVTAGAFALPKPTGGTGSEDSRISPSRDHRKGVSGAAAAGDGSRTDPVPCGTTCPCGPLDLPPTEGRISWRAINSLTRRWNAKILHGCWRGRPPTILMRLSKNRSELRLQRPWATSPRRRPYRSTRGGGHRASDPVPTDPPSSTPQVPGVTRGLSKVDQTPGLLRALPTTGLNTRGGSSGRTVGFPCHY